MQVKKTEHGKPPKKKAAGMSQKRGFRDRAATAQSRPAEKMQMVTLRASIPSALVTQAKKKMGIRLNIKLLETAIARLADEEGIRRMAASARNRKPAD